MSSRSHLLCLIAMAVLLINADLNLMSPNLTAISNEFGFSEREKEVKLGGVISIGFFLVGAPSALLFGFLSDKFNRIYLLTFIMLLSQIACFTTYFSKTYQQLLYCRIATGVGIGGSVPIVFSILGDLYSGDARIFISTAIGVAMSIGIALGQLLSGLIGHVYGWRLPFLCISIPSILLTLLILATGQEPSRGQEEKRVETIKSSSVGNIQQNYDKYGRYYQQCEKISSISESPNEEEAITEERQEGTQGPYGGNTLSKDETITLAKLKKLFTTPSVVIIFLQGFPGCIPWGVIYVFLNDFLIQSINFTHEEASISVLLFGIGGVSGQIMSGYIGQFLYNKNKRIPCFIMGFTTAISIPIFVSIINLRSTQVAELLLFSFFGGLFCSITGPIIRSILQNVCLPEVRGSAFAVFTLTDDLGKGFGPVIIVQILKSHQLQQRGSVFAKIFHFWIICSLLLLSLIFTISNDVAYVEEQIRSRNYAENSKKNLDSYNNISVDNESHAVAQSPLHSSMNKYTQIH
jgi:MFS family permease